MKKYKNDPYLLTARWSTHCKFCNCHIDRNNKAYYWPATKTLKCVACGEDEYKEYLTAAADEEVYAGTGNPY